MEFMYFKLKKGGSATKMILKQILFILLSNRLK